MKKLLVVGGLGLLVLLIVLWHELRAPALAAPITKAPDPVTAPVVAPPPPRAALKAAEVAGTAPTEDGKVNVNSDDFFDRFIERNPKMVGRAAMTCYRGGLHRRSMDQYITLSFVGRIKNGEVTYTDVKAKDSQLDDKELENCMVAAVAGAHFHDDSLPDVDRYEDTTTLTPERGGKKYMHEKNDHAPPAPPDTPR